MNGKRAKALRRLALQLAPATRVTPARAYAGLKKKLRKLHLAKQCAAKPINDRASRKEFSRPTGHVTQIDSQTIFRHPLRQVKDIQRREDYGGPTLAKWQLNAWGKSTKVMQDQLARLMHRAV